MAENSKIRIIGLYLLIILVYLIFPTDNSTVDAYCFAADIRYGNHLFYPHHLLYNALMFLITKPLSLIFKNNGILELTKSINSFFVLFNLIILNRILIRLRIETKEIFYYILFVAFSFNMLRFGTENEAYIIPIAFSMTATLFFLKYIETDKSNHILYAGLFSSIACLFHQIHIFWWLGLLTGLIIHKRNTGNIIIYLSSFILVPVVYSLVIIFYNNDTFNLYSFMHYVLHDFYTGSVKTEFDVFNIILIIISSIRAFIQVHHNILILLKRNILYVIPFIFVIYLIFKTFKLYIRKNLFEKREGINPTFLKTIIIILSLQLIAALYFGGNVDFLVFFPILLVLSLFCFYRININFLKILTFCLIIWNFSYGLYPNNKYNYYNDDFLISFIIQHPDDMFIVKDPGILNQYYYYTGIEDIKNIVPYDDLESDSDIMLFLKDHNNLYTDVIDKPEIFNRAKLLSGKSANINLDQFTIDKQVSYSSFYGETTINRISY